MCLYIVVSVFTDGRFSSKVSHTSYFEHMTCIEKEANNLEQCSIVDVCQSSCQNPIGIKCYGMYITIMPLLKSEWTSNLII